MSGNVLAAAVLAAAASVSASADVIFSEVLGYSFGDDAEFIEIANDGRKPIDITGWSIELWDADLNMPGYGEADGLSPYAVDGPVVLEPGQTYTFGNVLARAVFGDRVFDAWLPRNGIENGSYTALLVDADGNVVDSLQVLDGWSDATGGNRAGVRFESRAVVEPQAGTCVPGVFWRDARFNPLDDFVLNTGEPEHGTPGRFQAVDTCPADLNGDGAVTVEDLLQFLGEYRDASGNGVATVADLLNFLGAYREGC